MLPQNRRPGPVTYCPTRRGQTLIVAISILFVLLFIGGVFVAQVARNLLQAGRGRETNEAYALAEAGIRYCDEQLNASEDGADWRPAPTAPLASPNDPNGFRDPDYFWLAQGFSRVLLKGGRALVRVVYDPHPADPRSQLLRIESIGRPGELDPLDPTLFVPAGTATRRRRELIAYKQIGLTDYLRFITGKDRSVNEAALGVPNIGVPLAMVFGDPTIAQAPTGVNNGNLLVSGGIRSNINLRLVGDVFVYASPRGVDPRLAFESGILTAGQLLLEPTRDVNNDGALNAQDRQAFIQQAIDQVPGPATALTASGEPAYDSKNGLVRDGSELPDINGNTRAVRPLTPPDIETPIGATGINRYRQLTRLSGVWGTRGSRRFNTGEYGYGRGIYINNPEDLQRETEDPSVPGSYSIRADWLNPGATFGQGYWQGPFYRPPGVLIELLGDRIRFTRSDNRAFTNPDGTPITLQGGRVWEVPLSDFERDNYRLVDGTLFRLQRLDHDGDEPGDTGKPFGDKFSYGVNVVIMAEGNVRVRGVYGAITDPSVTSESAQNPSKVGRVHLTIVSGGTAYIEGNIVKGDGYLMGGQAVLERASTCAILAKDYVCINTTMFLSPLNQTQAWSRWLDLPAFYTEIGQARSNFDMSFSFGVNPQEYQPGGQGPFLFLRHAALTPGPTLINLLVNPAFTAAGNPLAPFYLFQQPGFPPALAQVYALGLKLDLQSNLFLPDASAVTPNWEMKAFPLFPLPPGNNYTLFQLPGYENLLRFQVDQTAAQLLTNIRTTLNPGTVSEYYLGNAFVAPLDIRIEAALYAQERSFFVIPGYPFNPEPDDSREAVAARNGFRKSFNQSSSSLDTPQDRDAKAMYPFYNEPADIRITVFGAVTENYPASIADQGAWLARWGYIPVRYGNSSVRVPELHLRVLDPAFINPAQDRNADFRTPAERAALGDGITRGLRFVYDPALALPYHDPTNASILNSTRQQRERRALRVRAFDVNSDNNPDFRFILPPAPRLPVSPDLLFFGDADRPLGQF